MCLVGACLVAFEYLNFTEFCYAEGRYLGDQGLCDRMIRYAIDHVRPDELARGAKKYSSVEEFNRVNPDSCYLEKRIPPRFAVWIRRLLGQYFLPATLWWKYRDEGAEPFTSVRYLIDACGGVRDGGLGGSANTDRPAPKGWGTPR